MQVEHSPLKSNEQNLEFFLQPAVGYFRVGKDCEGIECLSDFLDKFEYLVESDCISQQPKIDLSQLLPILRKLDFYMKNQDITGMTDLLEDSVIPLAQEIQKGCDEPCK